MSVDLHGKGGSESSSSISDEEDGKVWILTVQPPNEFARRCICCFAGSV